MRNKHWGVMLLTTGLTKVPRWRVEVFVADCEAARKRLPRMPGSEETELLLPFFVEKLRKDFTASPAIGIGATTSLIRRITGFDVSFGEVQRLWFSKHRYSAEEDRRINSLLKFFFGGNMVEKPEETLEEISRRAEECFRFYPKKDESEHSSMPERPISAQNLLELLDALAMRGRLGSNGQGVDVVRQEAHRLRIKCGFADNYLGNRIKEAVARAGKSAQPISA